MILTADSLGESIADRVLGRLFAWVLETGPRTTLEGQFASDAEEAEFTRRHGKDLDSMRIPARLFRSLMARLATLVGAPDPYGSVASFAWASGTETYHFRLFFCNEPTMDFWMRLYLYRSDSGSVQTS